jgi:hypothetical protein
MSASNNGSERDCWKRLWEEELARYDELEGIGEWEWQALDGAMRARPL